MAVSIPTTDRQNYANIASAIRALLKTDEQWMPTQFAELIRTKLGVSSDDADATENDIRINRTAYVKGEKITGALPEVEQATPSITIAQDGTVVATSEQDGGIVEGGIRTRTGHLPTVPGQTILPGTNSYTINAYQWLLGNIVVLGDPDLLAQNIKKGVEIFGVNGTLEGDAGGIDTDDATATEPDVLAPKTFYARGKKWTGTMPSKAAQTYTPGAYNQTIAAGQYLAGNQTILGDSNLVPRNIRRGVGIFGVIGTLVEEDGEGGMDTTATAVPEVVFEGFTFWANGIKQTGTYVPPQGFHPTGIWLGDYAVAIDIDRGVELVSTDGSSRDIGGDVEPLNYTLAFNARPTIALINGTPRT